MVNMVIQFTWHQLAKLVFTWYDLDIYMYVNMKVILSETLVQKSTAMEWYYYCQSLIYIYSEIFKDE